MTFPWRSYGVGYHDNLRRSAAETQHLGEVELVFWMFLVTFKGPIQKHVLFFG